MSDKPSAAWYLAPIFMGIIGSAIMWFVLKDEDHPDSRKMIKKGWIIGIVLTVISFAWIPFMLIPMAMMDTNQLPMQDHMQVIPEPVQRMIPEPKVEPAPAPVQSPQTKQFDCERSYPGVCIPNYPPDLDCSEISFSNFRVMQPDPHGFDGDKDGIGCES